MRCVICEFVSYLKSDTGIILHLNDHDVWETEDGKKLSVYDGFVDCNGDICPKSANGHGAIAKFFQLSCSAFGNCEKIHAMNFSSPKNFPKDIVKDIKDMKMIRMSTGQENWKALLPLILEKWQEEVIAQEAIYSYRLNIFYDKHNYSDKAHTVFSKDMLDNIVFANFVTEQKQEEILDKIKRIFKNNEGDAGNFQHCAGNIMSFFNWNYVKENYGYWNDIYLHKYILPIGAEKGQIDIKQAYYWHALVWDYFRKKSRRSIAWR